MFYSSVICLGGWPPRRTHRSPTTASYLYDGAGQRVQQAVTVNGSITTTTTYVAGGLEESVSNGAGTTLTKYFAASGSLPTLERVGTNGPLSVLASDGQGTVAESFDSAGNVTSAQLYTPYGVSRYSSGSAPTSHGYTGQVADSSTGLDYYHCQRRHRNDPEVAEERDPPLIGVAWVNFWPSSRV